MRFFIYYLICINLYGIYIMYYDKKKSKKGGWRIPEAKLFIISAALGSPGILCGMYLFRHKTKHAKFKYGVPFILIFEVIILMKIFNII